MVYMGITHLYNMRNRHPDRWPLRQWKPGNLPEKNDKFPKKRPQKKLDEKSKDDDKDSKESEHLEESCNKNGTCEEESSHSNIPDSSNKTSSNTPKPNNQNDNINTSLNGQNYKCQLVKTQAPDLTPFEDKIDSLNQNIKKCKKNEDSWGRSRDALKRKLCKAKGISQKDCLKYKLEKID
jgi:hypothetical protein